MGKHKNIYHRKDGRWEGRYKVGEKSNGTAQYVSVYGRSAKEVKEKLDKRKKESEEKQPVCCLTMDFLFAQWLDTKRHTVKETSYCYYDRLVQTHIAPALGHMRADKLTAKFLYRFMNEKLERGRLDGKGRLSPKTVQDIMIVVKSVLKLATQEYGLPDQVSSVKLPRTEGKEVQPLNNADAQRLYTEFQSEYSNSYAGFLLSLCAGLRLGEVSGACWSDIDWDSGVLRVSRSVSRVTRKDGDSGPKTELILTTPKSRCAKRVIPLPPAMLKYLRMVAQGQDKNAFITTGEPERFMDPRTYQYRFQSVLKRMGIPHIQYHGLRHTFATRSIQCGMDIKTLSEILGHSTTKMTLDCYVHSPLEVKRSQMERVIFAA